MNVRMKTVATVLAPCLLAALPALSFADTSPRYTYVQGGYATTDNSGDGYDVAASVALTPNFHLWGQWLSISQDVGSSSDDNKAYEFDLGLNYPLNPRLDLVARVGYGHSREEFPFSSGVDNENFYALRGMIRWMPTDRLELDTGLARADAIGNDKVTTYLTAGGYYDIIPNLAVGAELNFDGGSSNLWMLNVRYYFGGMSGGSSDSSNSMNSMSDSY